MSSLLTRASAAIDRRVARFVGRKMAKRHPSPPAVSTERRAQLIADTRAYNAGTLGTPSAFFPAPALPQVALEPNGDGPLATHIVDVTFASEYQPFLPAARDRYLARIDNMTAHARWWTSGRGRPTIVMLHGLGAGNHWVTAQSFAVPYWLRHGYDVVAFQLPFHGKRASSAGTTPSWPSLNLRWTNEGFGHAVYDLRALALFLRTRGASAVGVMGMSLGGYTAALWASVAGPQSVGGVDFAVAMIPAVSLARLMWHHGHDLPARKQATQAGISEDLLAEGFRVHAPTTRPPLPPPQRLFVIGGLGDQITPPEQATALAAHWHTEVLWFEGGHLAQLGRGGAFSTVRRALGNAGFSGREFRP